MKYGRKSLDHIMITLTTKSYTHISKHTLSPKQQVDSGVAPHDVICRNGLFLVERSTNEIACTHETTAQKILVSVICHPFSTWLVNKSGNAKVHAAYQITGDCPGFYLADKPEQMHDEGVFDD